MQPVLLPLHHLRLAPLLPALVPHLLLLAPLLPPWPSPRLLLPHLLLHVPLSRPPPKPSVLVPVYDTFLTRVLLLLRPVLLPLHLLLLAPLLPAVVPHLLLLAPLSPALLPRLLLLAHLLLLAPLQRMHHPHSLQLMHHPYSLQLMHHLCSLHLMHHPQSAMSEATVAQQECMLRQLPVLR